MAERGDVQDASALRHSAVVDGLKRWQTNNPLCCSDYALEAHSCEVEEPKQMVMDDVRIYSVITV